MARVWSRRFRDHPTGQSITPWLRRRVVAKVAGCCCCCWPAGSADPHAAAGGLAGCEGAGRDATRNRDAQRLAMSEQRSCCSPDRRSSDSQPLHDASGGDFGPRAQDPWRCSGESTAWVKSDHRHVRIQPTGLARQGQRHCETQAAALTSRGLTITSHPAKATATTTAAPGAADAEYLRQIGRPEARAEEPNPSRQHRQDG